MSYNDNDGIISRLPRAADNDAGVLPSPRGQSDEARDVSVFQFADPSVETTSDDSDEDCAVVDDSELLVELLSSPLASADSSLDRASESLGLAELQDVTPSAFPASPPHPLISTSTDCPTPLTAPPRRLSFRGDLTQNGEPTYIQEGDILLDKYRVLRVSATGLHCVVDGSDIGTGCHVQAVLALPPQRALSVYHAHFVRLAEILSTTSSRHQARLLEAGSLSNGSPFMVFQKAPGIPLSRYACETGPLSVEMAVDIVIQVCDALASVHASGLMHGSLSPTCVRVSTGSEYALAVLSGFGLFTQWGAFESSFPALPLAHSVSQCGQLRYLAPEQIRNPNELDRRSDVWSLGALLYELLTDMPPFNADTAPAILARIMADPHSRASRVRGDIPRALDTIICRCLNKNVTARYPTVGELARSLLPFASSRHKRTIEHITKLMAQGAAPPSPINSQQAIVMARDTGRGAARNDVDELSPSSFASMSLQLRSQPPSGANWHAVVIGLLSGIGGALIAALFVMHPFQVGPASPTKAFGAATSHRVFAATPNGLPENQQQPLRDQEDNAPRNEPPIQPRTQASAPIGLAFPGASSDQATQAAVQSAIAVKPIEATKAAPKATERPAPVKPPKTDNLFDDIN